MSDKVVVAVTGARNWPAWSWQPVYTALAGINDEAGIALLVHGGAVGLDIMAARWAIDRGIPVCEFPYPGFYGKRGGSIRNGWMLRFGRPDIVLAFPTPESRGTWDMVRQAREMGVAVRVSGLVSGQTAENENGRPEEGTRTSPSATVHDVRQPDPVDGNGRHG